MKAPFYKGLKDDLKDHLIEHDRPNSLTEYIELAVRIDNRILARRREKQGRHGETASIGDRGTYANATQRGVGNTRAVRGRGSTSWEIQSGLMELKSTDRCSKRTEKKKDPVLTAVKTSAMHATTRRRIEATGLNHP